jgi:hypothetical protein
MGKLGSLISERNNLGYFGKFGNRWEQSFRVQSSAVFQKSGEPFKFDVYDGDRSKNQKRYETIGDVITESIYEKLVEAGCKKIFVPVRITARVLCERPISLQIDASEEDARSFFFATDDAWDNKVGLAVLIHGSGAVRAGQWARRYYLAFCLSFHSSKPTFRLIINESLDAGTQLPYIREFKSRGFGVVVLNTNLNRAPDGQGKMQYVEVFICVFDCVRCERRSGKRQSGRARNVCLAAFHREGEGAAHRHRGAQLRRLRHSDDRGLFVWPN